MRTFDFDAYGNAISFDASAALTSLLYSGEEFNVNTGFSYLRARYYDPRNGRFTRMDPFFGDIASPLSLHKYGYVHGNPIINVDPTGESLLSLLADASLRTMIFAMDVAPKVAVAAWTTTKITAAIYLYSVSYNALADRGWLPESSLAKEVEFWSGAVLYAGFYTVGVLEGVAPRGRVPYGSTSLSRQVQAKRLENNLRPNMDGGFRNGAAVMYRDGNRLVTRIAFSSRAKGGGHAERVLSNWLQENRIAPDRVIQWYSELQPCNHPSAPNLSCWRHLQAQYPNAAVSWSYDYQNGVSPEQQLQSVNALRSAVLRLFGG